MTCRLMTSRKKYLCAPFAAIAMLATFLDFNMGEAHIPYIALDKHPSINNPLFIEDIQISRAIYQILNSSTPRSWIGFEAKAGEQLYFQVGIPALNELNDFRPSVFLYKPSQVEKNVGLDELIPTVVTIGKTPKAFHEPFTNTNSLILAEKTMTLAENGTYYLVSAKGENIDGKLWVAIGKEERFGLSEFAELPSSIVEVKRFHDSPNREGWLKYPGTPLLIGLITLFSITVLISCFIWRRVKRGVKQREIDKVS